MGCGRLRRHRGDRLPRAGFADQPQDFARSYAEAEVTHRRKRNRVVPGREFHVQMTNPKQREHEVVGNRAVAKNGVRGGALLFME